MKKLSSCIGKNWKENRILLLILIFLITITSCSSINHSKTILTQKLNDKLYYCGSLDMLFFFKNDSMTIRSRSGFICDDTGLHEADSCMTVIAKYEAISDQLLSVSTEGATILGFDMFYKNIMIPTVSIEPDSSLNGKASLVYRLPKLSHSIPINVEVNKTMRELLKTDNIMSDSVMIFDIKEEFSDFVSFVLIPQKTFAPAFLSQVYKTTGYWGIVEYEMKPGYKTTLTFDQIDEKFLLNIYLYKELMRYEPKKDCIYWDSHEFYYYTPEEYKYMGRGI